MRLYVLYVSGRPGGGFGQRKGTRRDQRHELPRPQRQECQRGRGGQRGNDPRKAIAFQRELEARAYAAGRPGGEYAAPAENIQSFLEGRGRLNIGRVQPTYDRGVVAADLGALLPTELADTLRAGLRAYERKIAGYTAPEAILTGLETRTSSPVRLKREENFECAQLAGLYPCGEGAGYAGGIMSAAVDGLRVARAIISRYSPAEG